MRFYNPRELPANDLERLLTGREEILARLLADLAGQARSDDRRHWLLRGPRGVGKSHLAAVVYSRVAADPRMRTSYLPVWLGEPAPGEGADEDLSLRIARRLRIELAGDPDLPAYERRLEQILGRRSAGRVSGDPVWTLLAEEARLRDRVLLVVVENLESLPPGAARARAGSLPALPGGREFLYLATACTRRRLPRGPFREHTLAPLDESQMRTLFSRLAISSGCPDKADLLGDSGDGPMRSRVLHRLTGGIARAIVMSFPLVSGASGVEGMTDAIAALLDLQTGQFEALLARLGPRERGVLTALCMAPENLPSRRIARACRLGGKSVAAALERLIQEGYLSRVAGRTGAERLYEVSDRLLRLWYRYHSDSKGLGPIVRFVASGQPPAEPPPALLGGRDAIALAESRPRAESSSPAPLALPAAVPARIPADPEDELSEPASALRIEAMAAGEAGAALRSPGDNQVALVDLGVRLAAGGRLEEAVRVYRHVAARGVVDEAGPAGRQVGRALANLGVSLGQAGRHEEAIVACRMAITHLAERREPLAQDDLGRALVQLGLGLRRAGRAGEAVSAFRYALSWLGGTESRPVRIHLARALVNLGVALAATGQPDEALSAFEDAVGRFEAAAAADPDLAVAVAQALLARARLLGRLGHAEEAIAACREVSGRFGESGHAGLQARVARSLVLLAEQLSRARPEGGLGVLRYLANRFGEASHPELRGEVARGLTALGDGLVAAGRPDESVEAYRAAAVHAAHGPSETLLLRTVIRLGGAYVEQGRLDEAVRAFEAVTTRSCESAGPELQAQVALALVDLGGAFVRFGRAAEGCDAYETVGLRFGGSADAATRTQVARALRGLGDARRARGELREAANAYREVATRFAAEPEPMLREHVGLALVSLGQVAWELGTVEEALAAYREAAAGAGPHDPRELQVPAAQALVKCAVALAQLGREDEGMQACREAIARFGGCDHPVLAAQVAIASFTLAGALSRRGQVDDARALSSDLVRTIEANPALTRDQVGVEAYWLHATTALARRPSEAEEAFSRWVGFVAGQPAVPLGVRLDMGLRFLMAAFPSATVRGWLETLSAAPDTLESAGTARLHRLVLEVMEPNGCAPETSARSGGLAVPQKAELGRVPPELRLTVEELAIALAAARRRVRPRAGGRRPARVAAPLPAAPAVESGRRTLTAAARRARRPAGRPPG